jgi:hypothetical protein
MLKQDVGMNAWTIWLLLSRNGKMSVDEICNVTECNDSFIYLTLGWLYKQDVISFSVEGDMLYTELNHPEMQPAIAV